MLPGCYKVDVLTYINPHLIWVEVRDPCLPKNEYVFEQIGVYGVLPLDKTIDFESGALKSQKCEEWLPAAAVVMRDFLEKNGELWFSPTHIDRRTSIFDDNIHKFGELILKTENGKLRKLSKHLFKSGFAYNDVCEFHEKLNGAKLKTELCPNKIHVVIKELENYYKKIDRPRNNWKKSVEKHTSIFQMSQSFEASLPVSNYVKDKNRSINEILKDKFKDLKLCKDIDEQSLGRANSKAESSKTASNEKQLKSPFLIKRLSMLNQNSSQTYSDIINFLDSNSNAKENIKQTYYESSISTSDDNTFSENDMLVRKENDSTKNLKLSRKLEKDKKSWETQLGGTIKSKVVKDNAVDVVKNIENRVVADVSVENLDKAQDNSHSKAEHKKHKMKNTTFQKTTDQIDNYGNEYQESFQDNKSDTLKTSRESAKPTKTQKRDVIKKVAYGPPGLVFKSLKIQDTTVLDYEDHKEQKMDVQKEVEKEEVGSQIRDCMYGEVDSEVGVKITMHQALKDFKKVYVENNNDDRKSAKGSKENDDTVNPDLRSNKYCVTVPKQQTTILSCAEINEENFMENNSETIIQKEDSLAVNSSVGSDDSSDKKTSTFIKRKLGIYHNAVKHDSSFSTSDTSNKDSSSDVTSINKTHDNQSIENVMERLNLKYKDDIISKKPDIPSTHRDPIKLLNNVNPFRNIDPNISVFVDKLVTPVLMVHSKNDNRIQPAFEMRDVYFNNHIHDVLKNMSITRPMMLQSISWFVILRGYSLFMISPKGSGKTLGYLPAVCRLISDSKSLNSENSGPVCIIVCATAQSVVFVERIAKMFIESKERVLACYAGVDSFHITTTLINGCDLLICTPSSLVRLMQSTEFTVDLRSLSTFVLDDCERLSEVYADEIKLFIHQIKRMLNTRANKELKVQYVLSSRIWCNFMEPLAKKIHDTVICIGAFQECVLYSKTNTFVNLVTKDQKVYSVFEFLKDIDVSKKTVIVCQSNDEVAFLEKALKRTKHVIFSCNNDMTIHDLYNLSVSWADYEEPLIGPILVCCDGNLIHMNITDAHYLIHYSMPHLFSMFCKRFSVLNDNYPSIFKAHNENVRIKVLLEESNVEQLPKILNFIKRCTDNIPSVLDDISSCILAKKDEIKAKKYYPICDSLLSLGYCPDFYNCQERHTILKDYDSPKDWLPKEGTITCKILHYHSATVYSARLLSSTVDGITTNYPQTYSKLSLKMGTYYSKESNRKLHGIPKIGDVCATSIKLNFYLRCIVLKILSKYERGNPNKVLVKLIDEERLEVTQDIYLYHLPEELKQIETQVVLVRLANIEPKDKDITFSDLARDRLKNITDTDTELFVTGNVSLTLGNCIFVNTLEACQDLTSLNEVVVKFDLKQELLENHAIPNPTHLMKLEKLCTESGLTVKQKSKMLEPKVSIKNLPKGTWAHLESDSESRVFFASGINPDKFFVRLEKFDSCMIDLLQDIQKHVLANPTQCENLKEGEIFLAKFPDDEKYERARVDRIKEDVAKCFFVDQGDWREIPLNHLVPITEQLINQLPFQAIECRLVGIQPVGDKWTDFSTNWFIDNCHDDSGNLKYLFVKHYMKEPAEFTKGHKYSVAVIDTNTEQDINVNQMMIDLNLAKEKINEICYLYFESEKPMQIPLEDTENDDYKEAVTSTGQENDNLDEKSVIPSHNYIFSKAPLRSVPLINSDNESDDSDKWDVNIGNDTLDLFPELKHLKYIKESTVNTIESAEACNKPEDIKKANVIELDSDDLTSPDNTFLSRVSPTKPILDVSGEAIDSKNTVVNLTAEVDPKRRPKLVWCQNKTSLTVKIQLIGADNYKLNIGDRILDFNANVHDTDYAFNLELYGVVDKEKCSHANKGQYILVKLKKVLTKNWLTLTKDGSIKKWIVYDVDNLDVSSEDETITVDDTMQNIVKTIHDSVDTESEDDDIYDDTYIGYKK